MTVLFTDPFTAGPLDTTTKWTIIAGGSPLVSSGQIALNHNGYVATQGTFSSSDYHFIWGTFYNTGGGAGEISQIGFYNSAGGAVWMASNASGGLIDSIYVHTQGHGGTELGGPVALTPNPSSVTVGLYIANHGAHKQVGIRQKISGSWVVKSDWTTTITFNPSYHAYLSNPGSVFGQVFGALTVEDVIPEFTTWADVVDIGATGGGSTYYTPGISGAAGTTKSRFAPPGTR